jgi:hypothetical protein
VQAACRVQQRLVGKLQYETASPLISFTGRTTAPSPALRSLCSAPHCRAQARGPAAQGRPWSQTCRAPHLQRLWRMRPEERLPRAGQRQSLARPWRRTWPASVGAAGVVLHAIAPPAPPDLILTTLIATTACRHDRGSRRGAGLQHAQRGAAPDGGEQPLAHGRRQADQTQRSVGACRSARAGELRYGRWACGCGPCWRSRPWPPACISRARGRRCSCGVRLEPPQAPGSCMPKLADSRL